MNDREPTRPAAFEEWLDSLPRAAAVDTASTRPLTDALNEHTKIAARTRDHLVQSYSQRIARRSARRQPPSAAEAGILRPAAGSVGGGP